MRQEENIKKKIHISICIITFNHELYIQKCLDSVFSQKFDGEFEVIIRDDASSDSTLSILKSYKEKYSERLVLLNSEINFGMNRNLLTVLSKASGDYIAICEGDDFWVSENKLQIQYNALIENLDCSFSVHPCIIHAGEHYNDRIGFLKFDCNYKFDVSAILSSLSQFAPTSSYMLKREVIKFLPDWFESAVVGDLFLELYSQKVGSGLYIPFILSAYRTFSIGSWTDVNRGKDYSLLRKRLEMLIKNTTDAQQDFVGYESLFARRVSSLQADIARLHLNEGSYNDFTRVIAESWQSFPRSALTQSVLYYFRFCGPILGFVFKAKAYLYKKFRVK